MLKTQWELYRKRLETVNCKAEQRRLLERGPPINISDKTALPCPDTEEVGIELLHTNTYSLIYSITG